MDIDIIRVARFEVPGAVYLEIVTGTGNVLVRIEAGGDEKQALRVQAAELRALSRATLRHARSVLTATRDYDDTNLLRANAHELRRTGKWLRWRAEAMAKAAQEMPG